MPQKMMLQQPMGSLPVCYAVLVAVSNSRHKLLEVVSAFLFAENEPLRFIVLEFVCHIAGQAATCMHGNLAAASDAFLPYNCQQMAVGEGTAPRVSSPVLNMTLLTFCCLHDQPQVGGCQDQIVHLYQVDVPLRDLSLDLQQQPDRFFQRLCSGGRAAGDAVHHVLEICELSSNM